jgi:acyl-coenzyme A thioesterase PaaI-like protein
VEHREEGSALGIVTFPAMYGTVSGTVKNGYLAAAADEVIGAALARMGEPIMTGILEIRFRRPCPAEREVRIEGRVRRMSGDVVFTEAGVQAAGEHVADADAVFFIVGEMQYREFAAERNTGLPVREETPFVPEGPEPEGAPTDREGSDRLLLRLCSEMVACDAPDELFRDAAEAVEALAQTLRREPPCRVDGMRNPLAPTMSVCGVDASSLSATLRFSSAFEGGPGLVHGGYVAAAFDEFLAMVPSLSGETGMCEKLKIRYRSPCPLNALLRMEGQLQKTGGHKIVSRSTMHAGDRLVADGEMTLPASRRPH